MKAAIVILIGLFFFSTLIKANVDYDHKLTTDSSYSLSLLKDAQHFERVIFDEESLLKTFTPRSVKLISKKIEGPDFSLVVEKKILGFVKRFTILGTIEALKANGKCNLNEESYQIYFDFTRSGPEVTDAVAAFSLNLCVSTTLSKGSVRSQNVLYYRGKKYGFITEPIAKSVLNEQVDALFEAVETNLKN